MQLSDKGRKLLTEWEGIKLKVYIDQAGYATIGVGHKLTPDELGSHSIEIDGNDVHYANGGITLQQAIDLLQQDVVPMEKTINHYVAVPLNQNQFDTLVSFIFNVGIHAFITSSLLKKLNAGQYNEVPLRLAKWIYIHSNGVPVVSQALVNRRNKEIVLWNTPVQ